MADLSLNRLPWYGQVGAFVALSLAGAGVFWNFYVRPAQDDMATRQAQLAGLRLEIDKGLATARRLPEFRSQVSGLEADLGRLKAVLPEEKDVADLLRRIQAMATESHLTIRGFTPRAVTARQLHAEWPIGLELEGRYHDLGAFLERVSRFPRIINVSDIRIKAKEKPDASGSILVECTATTFVLADRPQPGARPGARPGAVPPASPATRRTE